MVRRRNARLAARMEELGLTREGLADEVRGVLYASRGNDGRSAGPNERWVYFLLAGQTLWPQARYRAALETVLGCSALELGFQPPLGYRGERRSLEFPASEDDMDRRRFIVIAGVLGAATVAVPDLGDSRRIGMSDIGRLREPMIELRALDQRQGGANLASAASEIVAELGRVIDRAVMSAKVRRAAYALQGEYLATAGWFAIDAGEIDVARGYLESALTVAAMAREPVLQAHIWNGLAWQASEQEKWGELLAIAQAGMTGTAARRNPRIAASMHGWAADGYAGQGLEGAARRAIGRAHEAVDKAEGVDSYEPALFVEHIDHSEIRAFGSIAARRLGRYDLAESLAVKSIEDTPVTALRNRASRGMMLVQARLGKREIDGAVHAAEEPLARMVKINSGRLQRRLGAIRREFDLWSDLPLVREWSERFDLQQPV